MEAVNPEPAGPFVPPSSSSIYVSRVREQQVLSDALDQLRRGFGGVVLISGEIGIGKSALVQQLRDMASPEEMLVLTGYCYDLADSLPYGPWRRIFSSAPDDTRLSTIAGQLATPGSQTAAGSQYELLEVIIAGLKALAEHTRLVLILEDIHWADRASLDLLRQVSHHAGETSLLIIATYRTDVFEQSPSLAEMIPSLVRESNAHRIDLRRLELEDVLELVSASHDLAGHERQRLAGYLFSRAEGNPFFTAELLRDLEDRGKLVRGEQGSQFHDLTDMPVPAMVHQVISSRLQKLHPASHDLLELASVIGQDVPVELWRDVTDVSDELLIKTIQQAGSLHLAFETADGRQLRFNHALVRDTIYQNKPSLQRRQQHRQVAETLLRQRDPAPDHVAHHLVLAEDPRAVDWLAQASQQAERLHAAYDAAQFASRAIDVASQHSDDAPAHVYRIRARVSETLGDFDSAHQDLQTALSIARNAGDLVSEREALSDLGMLWSGKDYSRAGTYYQEALNVARATGDQSAVAQSLNRIGNWYANTGNLESAIELHQQSLQILEQEEDESGLLETHDLLGTTSFLAGNYRQALEHLEIAISEARRVDDKPRLASALTMIPIFGGNLITNFEAGVAASREPSYWLDCANEGLAISREISWKAGESFALTTLGAVMAVRGDPGQGLRMAEQGYLLARTIGHQQWASLASLVLGLIWCELEDPRRAELYLARCRATSDAIGSHYWRALSHTISGFVQLKLGGITRAAEFLDPLSPTESEGRSNTQRSFQLVLAQLRLSEGNALAALDGAESLLALEDDLSVSRGVPQVLKVRADALAALDRREEADQAYRDAGHAAELLGLKSVRWRVLAAHSKLLYGNGDAESAAMAGEATELVREIGQTIPDIDVRDRFIKRAIAQIPQVGEQRPTTGSGFGLSARELDVLRLAAQGLTNVEIGGRLFISPRTVAQHLHSIYGKLGVNSRTAAAAFAHAHDLA
jgi:DNA-binding CsgD family transcriptional regulator/tetratricopeptide (TPR) repeat protein